ncbi:MULTISPECIES: hypothetical protein [Methylobacterium]|uniref:hypothetical protein n=1 Tax=Methylobacterium TaxID=407 RepID=UPI0013EC9430|nr:MULTISPECIES: hypothetical protein [unclassified Methylobacterium]NGM37985.1 hypothetical protein [Methylobacterium sp. DB0501]
MGASCDPDADLFRPISKRDLDELGGVYLDSLAWDDWRAIDRDLLRSRDLLGAILAALGWRPDDATVRMPPHPKFDA